MKKLLIYVAGPYTVRSSTLHDVPRKVQQNIDRALEVANVLIEKGHYPFVPHLSHYVQTHYSARRDYGEWWYECDNAYLAKCDALFYIGWSPGANAELKLAHRLGLKIFWRLENVPDASEK